MAKHPRWRLVRWKVAGGPERFPARIGAGSGLDLPMHSDLVEQEEFVHHSPKFYACALSTRPCFDKQFASILAGLILPYVPSCPKR
jgi:hypothetical protein